MQKSQEALAKFRAEVLPAYSEFSKALTDVSDFNKRLGGRNGGQGTKFSNIRASDNLVDLSYLPIQWSTPSPMDRA